MNLHLFFFLNTRPTVAPPLFTRTGSFNGKDSLVVSWELEIPNSSAFFQSQFLFRIHPKIRSGTPAVAPPPSSHTPPPSSPTTTVELCE